MIRKSGSGRLLRGIWARCRSLRRLKQIHAAMIGRGFLSDAGDLRDLIFCSSVVLPGAVHYAVRLLDEIPFPDAFMWNTVIRGAAHSRDPSVSLPVYLRMERSGCRPNHLTFPFLLRAAAKLPSPALGSQIHAKVLRYGLGPDAFVRNALINFHAGAGDLGVAGDLFSDCDDARRDAVAWSAMISGYARRGDLGEARRLFDEAPAKDLVSWNVMVTAYAKRGEMRSAREMFDEIPQRDVVTWNAMIAGYVRCGTHMEAMEMFEGMIRAGETPDEVTLLSLFSACADAGALDVDERLYRCLKDVSSDGEGLSVPLGNVLIDVDAKRGNIDRALQVFDGMRERDVSSWNSIIGGLAFHGRAGEAVAIFERMRRERVRPDEITFVSVLAACSHAGMVERGREYFALMREEHGIAPNVKHYGCMVDMLGRVGLLEDAFDLVAGMSGGIEPNSVVLRSLLGSCRIHGEIELAERVSEQLLRMRRDASGNYVLLSSIYASSGRWAGAEKMRKMMDDDEVIKEAGLALVEHVHCEETSPEASQHQVHMNLNISC